MAFPLTLIPGALGALSGLFRKKRKIPNQPFIGIGDYNQSLARIRALGGFNPTPLDPNDPELVMQNARANQLAQQTHASNLNELSRAGLLGSSAEFGVLRQGNIDRARTQEDIGLNIGANRRQEQLGLYNDNLNFARQLEEQRLGGLQGMENQRLGALYGIDSQNNAANIGALGDLGQFSGNLLEDYLNKKMMYGNIRTNLLMTPNPAGY